MFILRAGLFLLALPWTVALAVVQAFLSFFRWPYDLARRGASTTRCPAGHPNPTDGRWSCHCGANYLGHAFAPCPVCGMPAGWMRCETCGLAIRSPWKDS